MALRFLKIVLEDGTLGVIKPTSLNTYHHNIYMEQIRAFMALHGTILPDPTKDPGKQYATKKAR